MAAGNQGIPEMVKAEISTFCIPLRLGCCLFITALICPAVEVQLDTMCGYWYLPLPTDIFHFHYSYCSSWFIPIAYVGKLGIGSAKLRYP